MKSFVLDTSIFTNPDIFTHFGNDAQEAIRVFVSLARHTGAKFFMPLSVYQELQLIKNLDQLNAEFESIVNIRSPRRYNLMIPGEILYEFIEEVRTRIDKGLRISEEHARLAHKTLETDDAGELINRLRDRYREALRQGILDSREDADVLMLAYELDSTLVSADEGLRKWADKVGVTLIDPKLFRPILENLIEHQSPAH